MNKKFNKHIKNISIVLINLNVFTEIVVLIFNHRVKISNDINNFNFLRLKLYYVIT